MSIRAPQPPPPSPPNRSGEAAEGVQRPHQPQYPNTGHSFPPRPLGRRYTQKKKKKGFSAKSPKSDGSKYEPFVFFAPTLPTRGVSPDDTRPPGGRSDRGGGRRGNVNKQSRRRRGRTNARPPDTSPLDVGGGGGLSFLGNPPSHNHLPHNHLLPCPGLHAREKRCARRREVSDRSPP